MARGAKRLPVAELIPEQRPIAVMRDDVIDGRRDCRAPFVVASGHHGRTTARTHPAKRILGAEQSRATIPTGGISALAERATRPIDFAGMGGASAAGDELAATGLGAIHQGHDSSGQTSVILTP